MQNRIFSTDSAKAIKADRYGYLNAIHYLAPADLSGWDLCSHRSPTCTAACLGWTSGQAGIVSNLSSPRPQGNSTRQSRLDKARRFMRDRKAYMADVVSSIEAEQRKAKRNGKKLCVRMNGSSDIAWEGIKCERDIGIGDRSDIVQTVECKVEFRNVYDAFPDVQFVDYTKNHTRFMRQLPRNLDLTFSRSETNEAQALQLLGRGINVAVVFADELPDMWHGYPVINGDNHDLRHLDPKGGYVVGLKPKGRKAKKDQSGFVVRS